MSCTNIIWIFLAVIYNHFLIWFAVRIYWGKHIISLFIADSSPFFVIAAHTLNSTITIFN